MLLFLQALCIGAFALALGQDCGRLDLVVILDNSGSVMEVFERERALALDLTGGIPIQAGGSQVGVVSFAPDAQVHLPLYPAKDRETVLSTISDIEFRGGSTNVVDAYRKARNLFANSNAPKKVIIIVTDGNSQNKWGEIHSICKGIRDSGIEIHATTQSQEYSEKELRLYTGDVKRVYLGNDIARLRTALADLAGPECAKPPVIIPPKATRPPATRPPATRPPATRRPTRVGGDCKVDVLFVVDTSGSVRGDFREEVEYADKIIQKMSLGGNDHVVGVIEYSAQSKQTIFVPWGEFQSTAAELVEKMNDMEYYGGTTYTAKALRLAKQMILDGRRPNTDLVVILIHDGITYDLPVPVAEEIRALPRVDMYAVGVNKLVLKETLIDITGDESKVFIGADSYPDLLDTMGEYLGSCSPRGGQRVDITPPRVTKPPQPTPPRPRPRTQPPQPRTRAPPPPRRTPAPPVQTRAPPPPRRTTAPPEVGPGHCIFDILIVLDTSNSVKGGIFANEIDRAINIVDRFSVGGPKGAQFAFIDFAGPNTAQTEFSFNKYNNLNDVKDAIRNAKFIAGTTAAGDALRLAKKELDPSKGARSNAEQIVIFISDGLSQQPVEQAAEELKRVADRVYAVATDRFYGPDQLMAIASDEDKWYHIEDPAEKDRYEKAMDLLASDC